MYQCWILSSCNCLSIERKVRPLYASVFHLTVTVYFIILTSFVYQSRIFRRASERSLRFSHYSISMFRKTQTDNWIFQAIYFWYNVPNWIKLVFILNCGYQKLNKGMCVYVFLCLCLQKVWSNNIFSSSLVSLTRVSGLSNIIGQFLCIESRRAL